MWPPNHTKISKILEDLCSLFKSTLHWLICASSTLGFTAGCICCVVRCLNLSIVSIVALQMLRPSVTCLFVPCSVAVRRLVISAPHWMVLSLQSALHKQLSTTICPRVWLCKDFSISMNLIRLVDHKISSWQTDPKWGAFKVQSIRRHSSAYRHVVSAPKVFPFLFHPFTARLISKTIDASSVSPQVWLTFTSSEKRIQRLWLFPREWKWKRFVCNFLPVDCHKLLGCTPVYGWLCGWLPLGRVTTQVESYAIFAALCSLSLPLIRLCGQWHEAACLNWDYCLLTRHWGNHQLCVKSQLFGNVLVLTLFLCTLIHGYVMMMAMVTAPFTCYCCSTPFCHELHSRLGSCCPSDSDILRRQTVPQLRHSCCSN